MLTRSLCLRRVSGVRSPASWGPSSTLQHAYPSSERRGSVSAMSIEPGSSVPQLQHARADLVRIGRVGRELQVTLQVLKRGAEALELKIEQAAVAHLDRIRRRQSDYPIARRERLRVLIVAKVDRFQIAQHARQDLLLAGRHQHAGEDGARYLAAARFAQ